MASWSDGVPQTAPAPLVCLEWTRSADNAALVGWCAYLSVDDEIGVYCPECAEREFGEDET
jgi:hypothetical protein